jgi:hypothetical protein
MNGERFERHRLRQPALMQFQLRTTTITDRPE